MKLCDKKFRSPRIWSNKELKKFSHAFGGKIVNVSGWKDSDKQGETYKDYFSGATEYWITNFKTEARGYQGDRENEVFLDLTLPLPEELAQKFDLAFNHTVLEHIFEIDKAFSNLCSLSKDLVIVVVPFLQEQHGNYGDYWRFTPQAIYKLFRANNLETIYLNCNDQKYASIYVFAIGSKKPDKWLSIKSHRDNKIHRIDEIHIGTQIIRNSIAARIFLKARNIF